LKTEAKIHTRCILSNGFTDTDSQTGAKPRSSAGEKGKVGERVMDEGWLLVVYDGDFREKGERIFFYFIY
jgi:hypothetical protein